MQDTRLLPMESRTTSTSCLLVNKKCFIGFNSLLLGVISEKCLNIIGNGVVVNLDAFFSELEHNGITKDLPGWEKRIFISNRAHLVLKVHAQVDGRQEESLDTKS